MFQQCNFNLVIMHITSEEPDNHWGFMSIKDRVILDLGCGKFHSSISTYEWFLNNGAKKVVGIDLGMENFEHPDFVYQSGGIFSTEQLTQLLSEHTFDSIKSDIEGAEIHFKDIDQLPFVTEIAIEYHDASLKQMLLDKFNQWGFTNIEEIQLSDCDINEQGVLFTKK